MLSALLVLLALVQPPPKIILPDLPAPAPQPAPPVTAPVNLSPPMMYVIRASAPAIVLASPQGVLDIQADTGPIKVRGIFSDAPTVVQTRTFSDANLYIVTAVGTGIAELLVVPSGATGPNDVIRRTINATAGPSPNPPIPPAPTDSLVAALQAAYSSDADANKAALLSNLAGCVSTVVAKAQAQGAAIQTDTDLYTFIHNTANAAVGAGTLMKTRTAVGAYLSTKLPVASGVPLTPAIWSAAAQAYQDVATALGKVK